MSTVVGIDVGGTKVAAARVEGAAATHRTEHPTALDNANELLDGIQAAFEEVAATGPAPDAVGVGVPSQIEFSTGTAVTSVNIPLTGVPLREELGRRFGGLPVFVDNDGNCAALAEAQLVPDPPAGHLVMLTLGTGVGGGLIAGGRIERGSRGLGGELGHIVIDGDTALAAPAADTGFPRPGSLEWHCSGRGLERKATAAARAGEGALGAALERTGRVTGRDVVDAARAGDEQALELGRELGRWLGLGIASMVNAFQPELLVVGGGLSRASDLFLDPARETAERNTLPALWARCTVELARGGSDAGVIGAGLLAGQELARTVDTAPGTER